MGTQRHMKLLCLFCADNWSLNQPSSHLCGPGGQLDQRTTGTMHRDLRRSLEHVQKSHSSDLLTRTLTLNKPAAM